MLPDRVVAVKVWNAEGATRGATSATDPQVVAGGVIVGLGGLKSPIRNAKQRGTIAAQ